LSAAIASYHLSVGSAVLVAACALLIGLNKTGLSGISLISIPIFAAVFGGRGSTGVVLLMFIVGDIFAVIYYNQHAQWRYIVRLLPWTVAGIVLGVLIGQSVSDLQFRRLMAIIIIAGLAIMVWQEVRGKSVQVPETWWIAGLLGLASGFSSMVGNAAAPIMALYLLSMRLPKNSFIGTSAWFFFIVNLIKLPFHIFIWHTITLDTVFLDLAAAPVIIAGAIIGVFVVRLIPEKPYRIVIITATAAAAIRLVF